MLRVGNEEFRSVVGGVGTFGGARAVVITGNKQKIACQKNLRIEHMTKRRKIVAVTVLFAALAAPVGAQPLSSWDLSGPGTTSVTGTVLSPTFEYNLPGGRNGSWTASATALQSGTLSYSWDYSGFHAFFAVRANLNSLNPAASLVSAGPSNCCAAPSNGFSYSGMQTIVITAGDTVGFTFGGSNADSSPALQGVLDILATFVAAGPTVPEEIATLAAGSNAVGRLVIVNSAGLARNRGQDSLTTRDETLSFTRVADPETGAFTVTQSTMDSAQMMGGIYTWVDFTGFRADDDDANRAYSGRGLQIGADMEVTPDMVVGLSLGVEDLNATVGAVNQDGVLRYLQPYLAYRSGAWSGEATLLYGLGDYTQTSGGGTGEGETRLAAITFNGGYDYALDQGVTLTPMLGLAHGVERIEGVSGTLAGAGTETVRFTQASLGAEISQSTGTGEIFAGFHADWLNTDTDTVLVQDLLVDDGWTGRLELGLSTEVGSGITLDTTVALSGLGGDLQSTSGSLRFAFRF
jgi:hypothetical protein